MRAAVHGLVIGPPGSGKGTLTSRLVREFPRLRVISTGDELRKQIAARTELGREAEAYIWAGRLMPDLKMVHLIAEVLKSENLLDDNANWLLDGFPRTAQQAVPLRQMLQQHGLSLNMAIVLKVPHDIIIDRIMNRWVHMPSGRVYNAKFSPPKVPFRDDITGELLMRRTDDHADIIGKRLESYRRETLPLVEECRRLGIVHELPGIDTNETYPEAARLVQQYMENTRA